MPVPSGAPGTLRSFAALEMVTSRAGVAEKSRSSLLSAVMSPSEHWIVVGCESVRASTRGILE